MGRLALDLRSGEEPRFTRAAARLGLAAAALGAVGLAVAWLPLAPPAWLGAVRVGSSLGLVVCGLGLAALQLPPSQRSLRRAGRAAGGAGALLGASGLLHTLLGSAPPWISVPGATALLLAGSAILIAARPRALRARAAEVLAGGTAAIGLLGLLGHFYRLEDLYRLGAAPMAPWTALGVGLLGCAGLVARPEFGMSRVLEGRSVGAAHFRRALPALLGIPLAAGLAAMAGVRLAVWDAGWAFAFFTLASMTALGVVGAVHARRIDLLVRERRRLESLFRRTFENAAVGMAHLDAEGRWLRVNERLGEMLGATRGELLQQRLQQRIPPDDAAGASAWQGDPRAADSGDRRFEQRFLHPSGETVWADVVLTADRGAGHWIAVVTDVTARKRAEADLELAQRALACSSDAVIVAEADGRDGRIVYVNPAFTRITGYSAEEALHKGWSFLGEGSSAQPALGELCRQRLSVRARFR